MSTLVAFAVLGERMQLNVERIDNQEIVTVRVWDPRKKEWRHGINNLDFVELAILAAKEISALRRSVQHEKDRADRARDEVCRGPNPNW